MVEGFVEGWDDDDDEDGNDMKVKKKIKNQEREREKEFWLCHNVVFEVVTL